MPSEQPYTTGQTADLSSPIQQNPRPLPQAARHGCLGARALEWRFFFLTLLFLLIATNTQTGWLYVICACLIALQIVAYFLPRYLSRGLKIQRSFDIPLPGQGANATITLKNESARLIHNILLQDMWSAEMLKQLGYQFPQPGPKQERILRRDNPAPFLFATRLKAQSQARINYQLPCLPRGVYHLNSFKVIIAGPLGLYSQQRVLEAAADLYQGPSSLALSEPVAVRLLKNLLCAQEQCGHLNDRSLQSGYNSDLRTLRQYREGDDIRLIHWSASAKNMDTQEEQLWVKEYGDWQQGNISIMLDLPATWAENGPQGNLEQALICLQTLADVVRQRSLPLTLHYYSRLSRPSPDSENTNLLEPSLLKVSQDYAPLRHCLAELQPYQEQASQPNVPNCDVLITLNPSRAGTGRLNLVIPPLALRSSADTPIAQTPPPGTFVLQPGEHLLHFLERIG